MKTLTYTVLIVISFLLSCQDKIDRKNAYVPESSGNLNHVNIVMPEKDWNSSLGEAVRKELQQIYEGLPIDEPQYSLNYLNPKTFTGFRQTGTKCSLVSKGHSRTISVGSKPICTASNFSQYYWGGC